MSRAAGSDREAALQVAGVSKRFTRDQRLAARHALGAIGRELRRAPARPHTLPPRPGEFDALNEINFELAAGESLALIGPNGAGKTTLLSLIAGVLKPDAGEIRTPERIGSILSLGSGLDPQLTGRENVAVDHAVAGDDSDLVRITDEVLEFSELGEEAFDAPVGAYSTGMRARLAFAIATASAPELLLVDEALAVGDFAFRRKCLERLQRYRADGGTLVFVSHDAWQIQTLSDRVIVLDGGEVSFDGGPIDGLAAYQRLSLEAQSEDAGESDNENGATRTRTVGDPGIAGFWLTGDRRSASEDDAVPRTDEPARVVVEVDCRTERELCWGFTILAADGQQMLTSASELQAQRLGPGQHRLEARIPRFPLLPGAYLLAVALLDGATHTPLATGGFEDPGYAFQVEAEPGALMNAATDQGAIFVIDVDWV